MAEPKIPWSHIGHGILLFQFQSAAVSRCGRFSAGRSGRSTAVQAVRSFLMSKKHWKRENDEKPRDFFGFFPQFFRQSHLVQEKLASRLVGGCS